MRYVKKKIIIIIVLKPNSGTDPGQDPGHESRGSIRVGSSQRKNKSGYYHIFKTQLGGLPRVRLGSRVGLPLT